MFILEDYIKFLQKQVKNKTYYFNKDTTDFYLEGLCQFNTEPVNYYKNIHATTLSKKYKTIFGVIEKPTSVSYNYWFLHKFGYKICKKCETILPIDSFTKDKHTWNGLLCFCNTCHALQTFTYRKEHAEQVAKTQQVYKQNNKDKIKAYNDTYRRNHLAQGAARSMKRYTYKLKACPKWLTTEQKLEMQQFYIEAKKLEKETGIKYQVDHIIPLQGVNVCGLHVPWNLQILTAAENLLKSNKLLV